MIHVSIIGSGNVAGHLISAFTKSEAVHLVQVFSRSGNVVELVPAAKITNDLQSLKEADLYIIAVSDSAIAEVSKQLPFKDRLVVHTSGGLSSEVIDPKNRRGVFYPLQTFTKNRTVDFREVPICIESSTENDYDVLEQLAKSISENVYHISSQQRKALHVAAVFANNFSNHLYKIAGDICAEHDIPFDILKPLIAETANKVMVLSPDAAQTGPAKRNDTNTIGTHLAFLTDEKLQHIYKTLTLSIIDDDKKL